MDWQEIIWLDIMRENVDIRKVDTLLEWMSENQTIGELDEKISDY